LADGVAAIAATPVIDRHPQPEARSVRSRSVGVCGLPVSLAGRSLPAAMQFRATRVGRSMFSSRRRRSDLGTALHPSRLLGLFGTQFLDSPQ
jgi:hypothetical protein